MGKYQAWSFAEQAVVGGAAFQAILFNDLADEDLTVVKAHVEICLGAEEGSATTTEQEYAIVGVARLVISGRGQDASGLPASSSAPFDTTGTANVINDEDKGDTWAMAPFVVTRHGQPVQIQLTPATKRKMRKGDQFLVTLDGQNAGADTSPAIHAVGTVTMFTVVD